MPQLVKGGKYVFGWSIVRENNMVKIPAEAFREYGYKKRKRDNNGWE
jgi:hypothetical protein